MPTVPALPSPLTNVLKWMLKHPEVMDTPFHILFDYISSQTIEDELLWRYVTVRYARQTPTTTVEDYAQFGVNITNITSGQLDTTWNAADYTAVDAAFQELLPKLGGVMDTSHTCTDVRYYQKGFNPDLVIGANVWKPGDAGDPPKRFAKMGPPAHIYIPTGSNGTVVGTALPYQTAMSVTFKTPGPKHWGRVYIPGVAPVGLQVDYGRWATSYQSTVANAFAEFADDLSVAGFQLVVPSTQQDGKYAAALLGVNTCVVDDIPDVIRRRRPKQPAIKQTGVPTP